MARAQVKEGVLRGCPVCGTKVSDVDLGLRDFRWLNEALPGKLGGMDVDFVLSQSKTGRVLHIEMKPPGARISFGARLTYAVYVKDGYDCWAAWGPDSEGNVQRGVFDKAGRVQRVVTMTQDEFSEDVALWWECGLVEDECA